MVWRLSSLSNDMMKGHFIILNIVLLLHKSNPFLMESGKQQMMLLTPIGEVLHNGRVEGYALWSNDQIGWEGIDGKCFISISCSYKPFDL